MPNENKTPRAEQAKGWGERARAAWDSLTNRGRRAEGAESQLAGRLAGLSRELTGKPLSEQDDDTVRELIGLDGKLGMINEAAEKRQLIENDPEVSQLLKSEDVAAIVSYLDNHPGKEDDSTENYKRGEVLKHLHELARKECERVRKTLSLVAENRGFSSKVDSSFGAEIQSQFHSLMVDNLKQKGFGKHAELIFIEPYYPPREIRTDLGAVTLDQNDNSGARERLIVENSFRIGELIAEEITDEYVRTLRTYQDYENQKQRIDQGYPEARQRLTELGIKEDLIEQIMKEIVIPRLIRSALDLREQRGLYPNR